MARNKFSASTALTVNDMNSLLHTGDVKNFNTYEWDPIGLVSSKDTAIFEANGSTVKNATNATNAVNATNATNATSATNVTGTIASTVTATTQSQTDNTQNSYIKVATTGYVKQAISKIRDGTYLGGHSSFGTAAVNTGVTVSDISSYLFVSFNWTYGSIKRIEMVPAARLNGGNTYEFYNVDGTNNVYGLMITAPTGWTTIWTAASRHGTITDLEIYGYK